MPEREKIDLNEFDDLEWELLSNVVSNLQICKHFYYTLYNSATDNFREMILSEPYSYFKAINKDIKLDGCRLVDILDYSDSKKLMKFTDYFYYISGRFPPENELVDAQKEKNSPCRLYEILRGGKSHGLVCA